MALIVGTEFDDIRSASSAEGDEVRGLEGSDTISGGPGNDTLNGNQGSDLIQADSSTSTASGNDSIFGGSGSDSVVGARFGFGGDTLLGNKGDDELVSTVFGGDIMFGGQNEDVLASRGTDTTIMNGDLGDDALWAGASSDSLFGGAGIDTLFGGTGDAIMLGEGENDEFIFQPLISTSVAGEAVTLGGFGGVDIIDDFDAGPGSGDILKLNQLDFGAEVTFADNTAGGVTVSFVGTAGGGSDDLSTQTITLNGVSVGQLLAFGSNDVEINGVVANSTNADATGASSFTFVVGGNAIPVRTGITVTGDASSEEIAGTVNDDTLVGNAGNDSLVGLAGFDSLTGNSGNDTLTGDSGNDTLFGNAGADLIFGGDGNDSLNGFGGGSTTDVGDTIEGGAGRDTIQGDDGNDSLLGNTGNDSIRGDAGEDYIAGNEGNDTLKGGDGNDTILGGEGNDTIDGEFGDDAIDAGAGEDTVFGGAGDDKIAGGSENDTIDGGAGNDSVYGGPGDDNLNGGAGNDTVAGEGNTNDIIDLGPGGIDFLTYFAPTEGVDAVSSFESFIGFPPMIPAGAPIPPVTPSFGIDQIAIYLPGFGDETPTIANVGGLFPTAFTAGGGTFPNVFPVTTPTGGFGGAPFAFDDSAYNFIYFNGNVATVDSPLLYAPVISTAGFTGIGAFFLFDVQNSILYWDRDGVGPSAAVALATLDNTPVVFGNSFTGGPFVTSARFTTFQAQDSFTFFDTITEVI